MLPIVYKIYADLHLYGVDPIDMEMVDSIDTIYLGDIYDYKNCLYSKLEECKSKIIELDMLASGRYVGGNHELNTVEQNYYSDCGRLFMHGDYELWGLTKANKFRKKKPGATALKRISLELLNELRPNDWLLNTRQQETLSATAKSYRCHTIVVAHKHPTVMHMYSLNGVKIVVVPRGYTEVEL